MDYEATDRFMSSWVVSCTLNGTRFYLTDERLASDMLSRAKVYRWEDEAAEAATSSLLEAAWGPAFTWRPLRVAEAAA